MQILTYINAFPAFTPFLCKKKKKTENEKK